MEELWKKHEDFDDYEFSNHGRFRKSDTKMILKNTISIDKNRGRTDGYVITFIKNTKTNKRQRIRIHRMVGLLFVYNPNPSEYNVINHIDGNKTNNHYTNLEWTNVLKNNQHAWATGLNKSTYSLDDDKIRKIRLEYINDLYITYRELAEKYSIKIEIIKNIINYKTRNYVDEHLKQEYLLAVKEKQRKYQNSLIKKYDEELINNILHDYVNGLSKIKLKEKYSSSHKDINNIIKNNKLPTINIYDGEIFKNYIQGYKISNIGRVIHDGIIQLKSNQFTMEAIGYAFIPNPNNFKQIRLIDLTKPIDVNNVEWYTNKFYVDGELFEELKEKYIIEQISSTDFKIKYNLSKKIMELLRKDVTPNLRQYKHIKPHLCTTCSDKTPENFEKGRKSCCKSCSNKNRYIRKPKRPYLCTMCGDNNMDNFKIANKGCCNKCLKIKYKKI